MRRSATLFALALAIGCGAPQQSPDAPDKSAGASPAGGELPVVEAQLGVAPAAAPPIAREHAAKVVVKLEVERGREGARRRRRSTRSGPSGQRARPDDPRAQGDTVELHLMNHPDNAMPHNIDLHAVTGPGGGAASTFTAPGHQTQFTFTRAERRPLHLPLRDGAGGHAHRQRHVRADRGASRRSGCRPSTASIYVVQGEFYTTRRLPRAGPPALRHAAGDRRATRPTCVFNGRDGALVGDRALTAKVGETVRLFVGNGGPNLVSSFHVIGEIFDTVYPEGGTAAAADVQTTLVPAGGSAIVEFKLRGTRHLHPRRSLDLPRLQQGRARHDEGRGPENVAIYSGREVDEMYLAERSEKATEALKEVRADGDSLAARIARGKAAYLGTCSTCHQLEGQGLASVFPPLASSDFLMADKQRSIRVVLEGLAGPITVNGQPFNNVMPPLANFTDHEIADVLSYVRNSFGNRGDAVTEDEVAKVRNALRAPRAEGHP